MSQHASAQKLRPQAPSWGERKPTSTGSSSSAVGGSLSKMQGSPGRVVPCNPVDESESARDRKMDYIADKMGTLEEMMIRQTAKEPANSEVKERQSADGPYDPHAGNYKALYEEEQRHKQGMILRLQQEEKDHARTRFEREEVQRENAGMNQGLVSAKDDIDRTERLYEHFMQELESKKKQILELTDDKDKLSRENSSLISEKSDWQQRLQDEKEDKECQMREMAAELNSEKVRRQALEKQNDIVTKRHLESRSLSEQQFAQEVQAETKRADNAEKELRSANFAKTAQQQERLELQENLHEMREEHRIARDVIEKSELEKQDIAHQLEKSELEKQDIAYQLDAAQQQVEEIRKSERRERTRQVEQLKLEEQGKVDEAWSRLQVAQAELDGKEQDLRQQKACLTSSEQALEQHRKELEHHMLENRDQSKKLTVVDKENKRLGGVVQDQKVLLWECESLTRQDRNAGKLMTPGEAARILKCRDDSFASENSKLQVKVATYEGLIEDIEQDLRDTKAENDHLKQVVNGRAGAR